MLISALAGARPIVGTAVGGFPISWDPAAGCWSRPVIPAHAPGSPDLTTTLRDDPPQQVSCIKPPAERYENHFSAEVWIRNLRALYERVIGSPERRRIALVEFPTGSGLYQFSLQLGEALARAGDDVKLITGPSPDQLPQAGCRVRSIPPTWHESGAGAPRMVAAKPTGGQSRPAHCRVVVLIAYLLLQRPDVVMWSEWRFPVDGGCALGAKDHRTVCWHSSPEPRPLVEQPGAGLCQDFGDHAAFTETGVRRPWTWSTCLVRSAGP